MHEAAFPVFSPPPSPDSRLPMLSFRRPSKSILTRFFAHLLIRLLVVTPLPAHFQAAAALFPVSMLWPLVRPATPAQEVVAETPGLAEPATPPASESSGLSSSGRLDPAGVKISDILVTPDNQVIVSQNCYLSTTCKGKATFVNLGENGMHPFVAGHLEGVGSLLALGENGVLYSSARSTLKGESELGGVQTAALGSLAFIQKVTPAIVQVDEEGKSIESLTATYRFISPPVDAGNASIAIYRGSEELGRYSIGTIEDGTFDITIPDGILFKPPEETLELNVVNSDGSQSAPLYASIEDTSVAMATSGMMIVPEFESVTPSLVSAGANGVRLRVTGNNLLTLSEVLVLDQSGEVTIHEPVSRDATSISMDLPAALLATPGVLQLSPSGAETGALAFFVFDPSLPAIGSSSDIILTSLDPVEIDLDDRALTLTGAGFTDGMSVVIGRESGGGVMFPVVVVSDTEIVVDVSAEQIGRADDLYIAVLSEDFASLSSSLPFTSQPIPGAIDYASILSEDEVTLTAVNGPIVWTLDDSGEDEQEIDLEGVGIAPGTEVFFSVKGGIKKSRFARASASPPESNEPMVTRVTVNVPKDFTAWPTYQTVLEPEDPRRLSTAGYRLFGVMPPAKIPLGGRKKFAGYQRPDDDRIYIVSYPDPSAGLLSCPAWTPTSESLLPWKEPPGRLSGGQTFELLDPSISFVTFNLSAPDTPHPFNTGQVSAPGRPTVSLRDIPLVTQEINPCEPGYLPDGGFYLRGERLPEENEYATVRATARDSEGQMLTGSFRVIVKKSAIGRARGGAAIEAAILDAAGKAGVPPQFLKAQVEKESRFNSKRYRYEPMTIDFKLIGQEGATKRSEHYIRRHLLSGSAASTSDTVECLIILGPKASPSASDTQGCREERVQAIAGQKEFAGVTGGPDTSHVRGRRGMPRDTSYRVVGVEGVRSIAQTPATDPTSLTFVEAPYWSLADKRSPQNLTSDQFQFEYATNTLTLGRALQEKEWIKLTFRTLTTDPLAEGDCGGYDVTKLNGRTLRIGTRYHSFQNNDTIGSWIKRNTKGFGGYRWLNGTLTEQRIEFRSTSGARPSSSDPRLIDRRLDLATAQFVAAGSFGLTQAAVLAWDHPRAPVLNAAFPLDTRCLHELGEKSNPNRLQEALLLTAAYHSYHTYGPVGGHEVIARSTPLGRWDQFAWAQFWSQVFARYNPGGPEYCTTCRHSVNGMSRMIRNGIDKYSPRVK